MRDKTYRYVGATHTSVTLNIDDKAGRASARDVILWRGREVSLPEGHPYTQQLLALGLLVAAEAKPVLSESAGQSAAAVVHAKK